MELDNLITYRNEGMRQQADTTAFTIIKSFGGDEKLAEKEMDVELAAALAALTFRGQEAHDTEEEADKAEERKGAPRREPFSPVLAEREGFEPSKGF